MPIDIVSLDKRIKILQTQYCELTTQIYNLSFIRDKLINGTPQEKRLIYTITELTIDNLNELMKSMKNWCINESNL